MPSFKKIAVVGAGIIAGEFVYGFVAPFVVGKFIPDSGAGFGLDDVFHAVIVATTVLVVQQLV